MKKSLEISTTYQVLLFSVGSIALLIGLLWLVFFPYARETQVHYSEFIQKKTTIEDSLETNATKAMLANQVATLQSQLAVFDKSVLQKGREIEFIQFLEELGFVHNMEQDINLNEIDPVSLEAVFPHARLTLTLEGDFFDFLAYLTDLEKATYYVNVRSINLADEPSQVNPITRPGRSLGQVIGLPGQGIDEPDSKISLSPSANRVSIIVSADVFWQ